MFKRSFHAAVSKDKAGKARKISKRSFRDDAKMRMYVLECGSYKCLSFESVWHACLGILEEAQ